MFHSCFQMFRRCFQMLQRCFQMFSNILKMLLIGYRYSLDILRCVQDVFSRSRMWNRINSQDVEKRKIANISCAMILISLTDSIHPTFTFLNSIHCRLKCINTRLCQFRNEWVKAQGSETTCPEWAFLGWSKYELLFVYLTKQMYTYSGEGYFRVNHNKPYLLSFR